MKFDSVRSAYLSIGPGARVLKAWKKTSSQSLNQTLRIGIAKGLSDFSTTPPLTLVPIPQSVNRRWELDGGSVNRLCEMILGVRKNPKDRQMEWLEIEEKATSQAKSRGDERYERKSPIRARLFDPKKETRPESILLVDDFLTSGATLRSAASVLREKFETLNGERRIRIDVFVMGFRPTLSESSPLESRETLDV